MLNICFIQRICLYFPPRNENNTYIFFMLFNNNKELVTFLGNFLSSWLFSTSFKHVMFCNWGFPIFHRRPSNKGVEMTQKWQKLSREGRPFSSSTFICPICFFVVERRSSWRFPNSNSTNPTTATRISWTSSPTARTCRADRRISVGQSPTPSPAETMSCTSDSSPKPGRSSPSLRPSSPPSGRRRGENVRYFFYFSFKIR